ncbi:unnamed protein product [Peronospora destructor]|uniref:Uncharacterized protein n=1 Tax=Peronospora destructor TaxID=86335 RepID=A0AAV0VDM1_9STRA|nr:unnamed protein product [Peronospora destructor]
MADGGTLLYSCAVYLYLYENANSSYAQETDAAVGCALLLDEKSSGSIAYLLLLYDTQKTPLLQFPVLPSIRLQVKLFSRQWRWLKHKF